ncbi:hypothetical protein [Variovorax sp. HJSM1_2]|uniref:hypothetical protein n=1 Tax=Variovorax sp. HJSM1_2 TaxID=3366263 RepID=UPI003BDE10FE
MSKKAAQKHRSNLLSRGSPVDQAWLDAALVGGEFGSPDYERLTELDQAAFVAFQSWAQVRKWLLTPNNQLEGACPEDVARSPEGFGKVMSILTVAGGRVSDDFMRENEALPVQERDKPTGL